MIPNIRHSSRYCKQHSWLTHVLLEPACICFVLCLYLCLTLPPLSSLRPHVSASAVISLSPYFSFFCRRVFLVFNRHSIYFSPLARFRLRVSSFCPFAQLHASIRKLGPRIPADDVELSMPGSNNETLLDRQTELNAP